MKNRAFQKLSSDHFPENSFFTHLKNGTAFYQSQNYTRAIEEFAASMLLQPPPASDFKKIDGKVIFKGDTDKIPLLFFLYAIYAGRLSGKAMLKSESDTKKYIFDKGEIIRAGSAKKKDRIGQYIVRRNILTSEELNAHLKEAIRKKVKIGAWLVQKDFLKEKTLKELLSLQTEEIVSDSLFFRQGEFSFMETDLKETPLVWYSPLKLAWIATHRGFNFEDFRKAIPNNKVIFKPAPGVEKNKEKLLQKLDANYQFIFFLVDGTRNIDQLIEFSGHNDRSVINILYKLSSLGLVRKTKEIREYEDKEFNEVKIILGVLFDIYHLVVRELTEELGYYGKDIIKLKQDELSGEWAKVFTGIPLDQPEKLTRKAVLRNISRYFPFPEKRYIFIDAFIELYRSTLAELKKNLGTGLSTSISENMRIIIENLDRFSMDTDLKSYMIRHLKQIFK